MLNETDVNRQKVCSGCGSEREQPGRGEGIVQVDFDLSGERVGLAGGGGGRAQQEQRQHHKAQGTSGSTKTFWSH